MSEEREDALFEFLAHVYVESELDIAEKTIPEINVSKRFKNRIRQIIMIERGIVVARKVAAVILIFVLGFATLVMINEDVRAAVKKFLKETFSTHTTYNGMRRMRNSIAT